MSASGVRSMSTTSSAWSRTLVGEGLAHAHARELGHLVVERLEVLDVDRGEHVDAGLQHVLDVLVALGVLEAGGVGVGELVDQAELRRALEDGRQVHLLQPGAAVLDAPARELLEPLGLRERYRPGRASPGRRRRRRGPRLLGLALLEHPVGLAHPGRHAEEDLVAAAALAPWAPDSAPARQAPSRLCTMRSISLMPMNGAISPPSP